MFAKKRTKFREIFLLIYRLPSLIFFIFGSVKRVLTKHDIFNDIRSKLLPENLYILVFFCLFNFASSRFQVHKVYFQPHIHFHRRSETLENEARKIDKLLLIKCLWNTYDSVILLYFLLFFFLRLLSFSF